MALPSPIANVIDIGDADDPRLADYRDLRDRDLRREAEGLFVGEQMLVVERMLRHPGLVRSVLVGEPMRERVLALFAPPTGRATGSGAANVPVFVAPGPLLERLAGFPVHRGVLAIGVRSRLPQPGLDELAAEGPRTLLLVEDITHADNIGQLFRIAAALAVDGVLLSPRCHDPLYRRCVRVSIGHVLGVPWRRSDDWGRDLDRLRGPLGVTLVGAATGSGSTPLDRLATPSRGALIVGTEFAGLATETLRRCSVTVRIPMAAGVDSLNVAVAAGICLHRLSPRGRD